jgi:hypothetical protein
LPQRRIGGVRALKAALLDRAHKDRLMVESECQEVLEKFEFFPLKCRVQRALEIYEISQRQKEESTELEYVFKTKVPCCSFTHASFNIQRHFYGQTIYAVLQCQRKFPASVCVYKYQSPHKDGVEFSMTSRP